MIFFEVLLTLLGFVYCFVDVFKINFNPNGKSDVKQTTPKSDTKSEPKKVEPKQDVQTKEESKPTKTEKVQEVPKVEVKEEQKPANVEVPKAIVQETPKEVEQKVETTKVEEKQQEVKEVPKEETKVEEKPKVEETKVETSRNLDSSKNLSCPSKLHKYIIGDKGSVIKGISSTSKCKLDLKEDNIEINGDESNIIQAKELILNALEEVGWFYENNQWVERTKQDELWKKYRGDAEKEVQLRGEKFEKSKQAFESGNKELAKQLSDEAKQHDENFKRLNKEAGENIFKEM